MKLHWLQHVPFEGLGCIKEWTETQGIELSCTRFYAGEWLPAQQHFDGLIVMGGPMSVHDRQAHPWLPAEKTYIRRAIDTRKTVLGICLGAQLIADALGTKVYPGPEKEIGWFPVQRAEGAPELISRKLTAFHWHRDTFEIPAGAVKLAFSEPGINQGFTYKDRVVGLQFHLEITDCGMEALLKNCGSELMEAPYIQTAEQMRGGLSNIGNAHAAMNRLLDSLIRIF